MDRASALTGPVTITLQVPHSLSVLAPTVVGARAVSISASASVAGTIVAMSNAGFSSEPDSTLSDIWSRGPAILKDRDKVTGTVHASNIQKGSNVIISGGIDSSPAFDPVSSLSWTVTYPVGTANDVIINAGETRTLSPGLYGNLVLNSQATLKLSTGTYYLSSLDMEAASKIHLDQTSGPVIIYETTGLTLRGAFDTTDGSDPDLLLGYLSTNSVIVEAKFAGTLVAPFAALSLRRVSGVHRGYFYAQSVADLEGAAIEYRAPSVLAEASGVDVQACAELIRPRDGLTGKAQADAYQADIARYCTAPGLSNCVTTLIGRANADYAAMAKQTISQTASPAQYLALSRDRRRKLTAARHNVAQATFLCTSPDADHDWVPDSLDRCPKTPDLTATGDDGCTITALPKAPSAADVHTLLAGFNLMGNPFCVGAPRPPAVSGAAVWQTASPSNGLFIVSTSVTNQPAGCGVWYLFEVRPEASNGAPIGVPFLVTFEQGESVAHFGGLSKLPLVPPEFIQFVGRAGDPGTRTDLANLAGHKGNISIRVQAVNGNGARGPWSDWKSPSQSDCRALGVFCQ